MKRLLLTSASLLARITATATASATTTTIPFSGAIVDFIVPADGAYQILAFGAQGGSSTDFIHKVVSSGGKGRKSAATSSDEGRGLADRRGRPGAKRKRVAEQRRGRRGKLCV